MLPVSSTPENSNSSLIQQTEFKNPLQNRPVYGADEAGNIQNSARGNFLLRFDENSRENNELEMDERTQNLNSIGFQTRTGCGGGNSNSRSLNAPNTGPGLINGSSNPVGGLSEIRGSQNQGGRSFPGTGSQFFDENSAGVRNYLENASPQKGKGNENSRNFSETGEQGLRLFRTPSKMQEEEQLEERMQAFSIEKRRDLNRHTIEEYIREQMAKEEIQVETINENVKNVSDFNLFLVIIFPYPTTDVFGVELLEEEEFWVTIAQLPGLSDEVRSIILETGLSKNLEKSDRIRDLRVRLGFVGSEHLQSSQMFEENLKNMQNRMQIESIIEEEKSNLLSSDSKNMSSLNRSVNLTSESRRI